MYEEIYTKMKIWNLYFQFCSSYCNSNPKRVVF